MAYFTPSTKPAGPRFDLLAKQHDEDVDRAILENTREPYVINNRSAVWVGDRIASVIENPTPLWWYIAVSIAAAWPRSPALASFT